MYIRRLLVLLLLASARAPAGPLCTCVAIGATQCSLDKSSISRSTPRREITLGIRAIQNLLPSHEDGVNPAPLNLACFTTPPEFRMQDFTTVNESWVRGRSPTGGRILYLGCGCARNIRK